MVMPVAVWLAMCGVVGRVARPADPMFVGLWAAAESLNYYTHARPRRREGLRAALRAAQPRVGRVERAQRVGRRVERLAPLALEVLWPAPPVYVRVRDHLDAVPQPRAREAARQQHLHAARQQHLHAVAVLPLVCAGLVAEVSSSTTFFCI